MPQATILICFAFLINSDGKIKAVFKGVVSWNDEKIRSIILDEMENAPEMPRNSYVPPVMHKISKSKIINLQGDSKSNVVNYHRLASS